jgi:4-carboxymuconolactone decarboxylase
MTGMSTIALALITGSIVAAGATFSPRLTTPRLAPVPQEGRTEAQAAMLASRPDYNVYKTLAHDIDLYNAQSPLGQFLMKGSSLPPREREIVILRMGWLCQAEYEWAQHARVAKGEGGLTDAQVHLIAEGPTANGWPDFERALITMVDEIRYEAVISAATWRTLRTRYSEQQTIESMYTASHYQMVSMALNSLGVQLDPDLEDRLPKDVTLPKLAGAPTTPRPRVPRLATAPHHPKLYSAHRIFGSYLQRESHLPPKTRELVIMRTAWLVRAEYEWGQHAPLARAAGFTDAEIASIAQGPDGGWNDEYKAVLRALDELRREAFISDASWAALAKHYDTKQLIEIIYTSGGYAMTVVAGNSAGHQE